MATVRDLVRVAVRAAEEKKAKDVKAIDIRGLSAVTDYMIIATGSSDTNVRAIAEGVREKLLEKGERPFSVEGLQEGSWVLLDYVDFVVHVFHYEKRALLRPRGTLGGRQAGARRRRCGAQDRGALRREDRRETRRPDRREGRAPAGAAHGAEANGQEERRPEEGRVRKRQPPRKNRRAEESRRREERGRAEENNAARQVLRAETEEDRRAEEEDEGLKRQPRPWPSSGSAAGRTRISCRATTRRRACSRVSRSCAPPGTSHSPWPPTRSPCCAASPPTCSPRSRSGTARSARRPRSSRTCACSPTAPPRSSPGSRRGCSAARSSRC